MKFFMVVEALLHVVCFDWETEQNRIKNICLWMRFLFLLRALSLSLSHSLEKKTPIAIDAAGAASTSPCKGWTYNQPLTNLLNESMNEWMNNKRFAFSHSSFLKLVLFISFLHSRSSKQFFQAKLTFFVCSILLLSLLSKKIALASFQREAKI